MPPAQRTGGTAYNTAATLGAMLHPIDQLPELAASQNCRFFDAALQEAASKEVCLLTSFVQPSHKKWSEEGFQL